MNKFWRIILVVLALVGILVFTCNAANAEEATKSISSENIGDESEFSFTKIEQMTDEEAIKAYRKAVRDHEWTYWTYGYYLEKEEYDYLEKMGFEVCYFNSKQIRKYERFEGFLRDLYYPIIFESENGIELWYTTNSGQVFAEALEGKLSNGYVHDGIGDANHTLSETETSLRKCMEYDIVYDCTEGTVSVWELGVKIREHIVPKNSIYGGFSRNEGFIFRKGSDVYAVRDYGCGTDEYEVRVIAHDVDFVIMSNYTADDPSEFSQPLFLMNDGTVKCYCTFYSDEGTPTDHVDNLIDIRFEGGFNI